MLGSGTLELRSKPISSLSARWDGEVWKDQEKELVHVATARNLDRTRLLEPLLDLRY